ncbi:hypothetical protein PS662_00586 [Pseudomonas fluorescens]|uniref:Uncharacterized protein n=1 Tax=Pseudomonas fluorescens TaxID=294 RepID=A0A5E6PW01_PSEFL|nr:hypothetical protein [Pseudomonas fluorescens]VVM47068.1 hypothetical protein PS662_00586 [Pseudomonas fluorescens]
MNVIIRTAVLSKQADAYFIKNPYETQNARTITDAKDAAGALNLTSDTMIGELKNLIKGYDFTSISTNELAKIGSKLYEVELIDRRVAGQFISGNMTYDEYGFQTEKDVKYNAIAMFNQMLGDTQAYASTWPMYAHQESFKVVLKALEGANQVINALSYFSHSTRKDLSVSIQA